MCPHWIRSQRPRFGLGSRRSSLRGGWPRLRYPRRCGEEHGWSAPEMGSPSGWSPNSEDRTRYRLTLFLRPGFQRSNHSSAREASKLCFQKRSNTYRRMFDFSENFLNLEIFLIFKILISALKTEMFRVGCHSPYGFWDSEKMFFRCQKSL